MQKVLKLEAGKSLDDASSVTLPRVTRVTPEGRLIYDPISVISSDLARKHLKELEKQEEHEKQELEKHPAEPKPTEP